MEKSPRYNMTLPKNIPDNNRFTLKEVTKILREYIGFGRLNHLFDNKVIKKVIEEENGEKREKETYGLSLEKRVAELEKMVYELHQIIKSK